MKRFSLASVLLASAAACGGGNSLPTGPSPVTATVELRYASKEEQASVPVGEPYCAGQVRVQPSFWGFAMVTMVRTDAGYWAARFEEVPVGRHSVRVRAAEGCGGGELLANGVPLTDGGTFSSFTVRSDGSVEP